MGPLSASSAASRFESSAHLRAAGTESELSQQTLSNHAWWRADINPDVWLVRCWFLEIRELAVEQARWHEVRLPRGEASCYGRLGTGQKHE